MSVFPNNILNVHAYVYQHTSILEKSAIKSVYIMDVIVIVWRLKLTNTTFCSGKTTLEFILFRHLFFSEELDLTEQKHGRSFSGNFY